MPNRWAGSGMCACVQVACNGKEFSSTLSVSSDSHSVTGGRGQSGDGLDGSATRVLHELLQHCIDCPAIGCVSIR
jgi:diaminopimelate epimerase